MRKNALNKVATHENIPRLPSI